MELNQLRYFLAVAEAGNFTRAAERSHLSQPSLSQQVINLERELGHKLFHRLGRRAVLTEAGQVFLGRARTIVLEVEDASKALKDSPTLERRIKVGTVQTLAPYLLPRLLERCRESYPTLSVNTHEDFRPDLVRGVVDGDLDLAIVPQPVKDPRISVELLFTEPLLLVVGRNHPLAAKPTITAPDLAEESFVLLGHSSTLAMEIERFCGDHNFLCIHGDARDARLIKPLVTKANVLIRWPAWWGLRSARRNRWKRRRARSTCRPSRCSPMPPARTR